MIAIGDLHLYNDTPVIEEGGWKLLTPSKWAVKWRHLSEAPIVVHICDSTNNPWKREYIVGTDNMKNGSRCEVCNQDIPEGIQALWQLTHDKEMLG